MSKLTHTILTPNNISGSYKDIVDSFLHEHTLDRIKYVSDKSRTAYPTHFMISRNKKPGSTLNDYDPFVNTSFTSLGECQEVLSTHLVTQLEMCNDVYVLVAMSKMSEAEVNEMGKTVNDIYKVVLDLYKKAGIDVTPMLPEELITFEGIKDIQELKFSFMLFRYKSSPNCLTVRQQNNKKLCCNSFPIFMFFFPLRFYLAKSTSDLKKVTLEDIKQVILKRTSRNEEFVIRYIRASWLLVHNTLDIEKYNLDRLLNSDSHYFRGGNFRDGIWQYEREVLPYYTEPIVPLKEEDKSKMTKKQPLRRIKVFSRHPSHSPLRQIKVPGKVAIRFGSQTPFAKEGYTVFNSVDAVANASSKFRMKRLFADYRVKTAIWCIPTSQEDISTWIAVHDLQDCKFITKSEFGSRGVGLRLHENANALVSWFNERPERYGSYLLEKYYPYVREYRLHVTNDGCFYTCRKMLKTDATERWFRNDSNSVWIMEENPKFEKPVNWKQIEGACVEALKATGLDFGACDVRVQSADKQNPDFIICEINSAPSFGEKTLEHYIKEITKKACAD